MTSDQNHDQEDDVSGVKDQAVIPRPTAQTPVLKGHNRRRRALPELAALVVVLAALIVFFSIRSPYFLTQDLVIGQRRG